MKILLANHHFQYYGGSETATLALYQALAKKGHDVDVWSAVKSVGGIREEVNFVDEIKDHYDLALVNHNVCLKKVNEIKCADKVIYTSHGPMGGLEKPIEGADIYCGVSEEVRDAYTEFDIKVVRNPVDTIRFNLRSSPSNTPKTVLLLSNRITRGGIDKIKAVCDEMGLELVHCGLSGKYTNKIEDEIEKADIVITVGRGVLEAMAMGKQVLVWDHRPYNGKGMGDGMITPPLYLESRKHNFSGRAKKIDFTHEQIRDAFKNYKPINYREIISRYHDAGKIADEYIALSKTIDYKIETGKKKICILAGLQHFHRSYSLSGIIKTQAKLFSEQGHDVALVVHKNLQRSEAFNDTGATIHKLLDNPQTTVENLKPLIEKYDIILTHDFVWIEAMKWLNKVCDELEVAYPDKLFIHQIHSSPGNESAPEWKLGRNRPNVYYSHPAKMICDLLPEHLKIPKNKVIQIEYTHDFIDEGGGDENLYHELDIVDKDFVGFYPCHPMPGKNIPAILHIVKEIKDLGKSIKYIFTVNGVPGGRTRVDDYKDLAKKLDIEDCIVWMYDIPRFRHVVDYDVVQKIWKRTNLFIHPSLSEANPLILLEAMWHGCIIVANEDFDRFKEMVGDKRTDAIYHAFGSHLKGNQKKDQDKVERAKKAAQFIVKAANDSFQFRGKQTVAKYYRKNIYNKTMNTINGLDKQISVVIPILNVTSIEGATPELIQFTKDCIKSVGNAEVLVINNCPDDKNEYSSFQINNPYNYGVSRAWNQGLVNVRGEYILFLNSDVVLPSNWQDEMLKYADQGLVFPWYSDHNGEGEIPPEKASFPQIQGSCFMAHRDIFRKIGPFDQERYFAYAEDQDYWMRARGVGVKFYRANCVISHKMNATSSKINAKNIYNKELVDKYGEDRIFNKIFTASNQAFENWWGEGVKGV